MGGGYRVTVRRRGRTEKERHEALEDALDAIGRRLEGPVERRATARPLGREVAPVAQVAARLEVRGPGVRGGVDVRGDGSTEAYTGRVVRRLVARRTGEDALEALRRALGDESGAGPESEGP